MMMTTDFPPPPSAPISSVSSDSSELNFDPGDALNRSARCLWAIGNLSLCHDDDDDDDISTVGPWRSGHVTFDESPTTRNYWTLILLVFPVLTVFGNVLVVLSVWRERSLRTVTNYFIVSLAIADIMVAILVMPVSVYVEVNNSKWFLGDAFCDTWVAFDVMCCTASILNLTAISVDRFIAVTQPIKYAKHKNSNRVYAMLGLTWVVSLAISSPIALGMNYTERRLQTPTLCIFYNSDFIIYSSMGSFYIPCIVMILLYWRIFTAIRQRSRKSSLQNKRCPAKKSSAAAAAPSAAETVNAAAALLRPKTGFARRPPEPGGGRNTASEGEGTDSPNARTELIPARRLRIAFLRRKSPTLAKETSFIDHNVHLATTTTTDTEQDTGSAKEQDTGSAKASPKILADIRSMDENASTDSAPTPPPTETPYTRHNALGYSAPVDVRTTTDQMDTPVSESQDSSPGPSPISPDVYATQRTTKGDGRDSRRKTNQDKRQTANRRFVTRFNFNLKKRKRSSKDKGAVRRERKATKTLAIVLGVFLFCWVPFFTINIINAICIRYDLFEQNFVCDIDPILFSFFVWLGYINSFLNPVIYTIFNIEFRRAFKKILTIKRR